MLSGLYERWTQWRKPKYQEIGMPSDMVGSIQEVQEEGKKEETVEEERKWWKPTLLHGAHFVSFLGLYALWIVLSIFTAPKRRYIWISCLFGPFGAPPSKSFIHESSSDQLICSSSCTGAYIRYFLSKHNARPRFKNFPFFTFIVNVLGSYVLAVVAITIQIKGYNVDEDVPGYILHGFQVGFFGSFLPSLTYSLSLSLSLSLSCV